MKTYTVGIGGGSAGGKSTLALLLKKELAPLPCHIISMDGYFKPPNELPLSASPLTGEMIEDYNLPSSLRLDELRKDLCTLSGSGEYSILIVEGLFTLWDAELSSMLDLRLYVDCPADVRIVRRLKRNMMWGLSFDDIARPYTDLVRFRHEEYVEQTKWHADLIINGAVPTDDCARTLAGVIRDRARTNPAEE